jgi:hypothetical protein
MADVKGLTVNIRIRDMEWFKEFKDIVVNMLDDKRIQENIRKEYHGEMMAVFDKYHSDTPENVEVGDAIETA